MNKLMVDLRAGESMNIGHVRIRMVKKSGQLARLEVHAPEAVQVKRFQPGAQECTSREKELAHGQYSV